MQYNKKLFESLVELKAKYIENQKQLETINNSNISQLKELNKLNKKLQPIISLFDEYEKLLTNLKEAETIIETQKDASLIELAQEELSGANEKIEKLEYQLKQSLLEKDPNDEKNVIVEMRPAAGGNEASIFVSDLFDAYKRFFNIMKWNVKILEVDESAFGLSFISFAVSGQSVYSKLKFESGVHRVQRVPATESKGRVHTSTITVAVLPEVEETEVVINPADLRIDTYRASGAGGQHVNRTESAVRITHLPTNISVACQEGKSQIENRETAFKMLRAKLWEMKENEKNANIANLRKNQVGTGERSEKIRTYNYPQNRITDHRINLTLNKLDNIMESGGFLEIIDLLISHDEVEKMKQQKF